jgi:hypothetical protein
MSETKKRECLRFSFSALGPVFTGKAPEFDKPSFIPVKPQFESLQSCFQVETELFRIFPFLEPYDEIVGVLDDAYFAFRFLLSPYHNPLIQRVMKIHPEFPHNYTLVGASTPSVA